MSIIQVGLTREQWFGRYHTIKTTNQAKIAMNAFDAFLKSEYKNNDEEEILSELRDSHEQKRYIFLDQMVQFWNQDGTKSPATIENYFMFIRSYLRSQGIKTHPEDIKEYVSFPKKLKEIRRPLQVEQIRELMQYCNREYKAFFLVLASSGMRMGEVLGLTLDNVDFKTTPTKITIPARITKTKQERECYISGEATKALKILDITEKLFPKMSQDSVERWMSWLRKKSGLTEKYSNGKNYHVNVHSFRAFFHTKATLLHGVEYAHAVIGHGSYLQQYFRLTDEERSEKYKELEPFVTIYDDAKLKAENKNLQLDHEKMAEMQREIQRLKDMQGLN